MIRDELSNFAHLANWAGQLEALANLAQGEPWDFLEMPQTALIRKHYILDRYLRIIFRRQAVAYNCERDAAAQDAYLVVRKNLAVLHTGLVTPAYKPIYMVFRRNGARPGVVQDWTLKGFAEDTDKGLLALGALPRRPQFPFAGEMALYLPEWPIRIQFDRLLSGDSLARLPDWLKGRKVLPVYLESCIEMSRLDVEQSPQLAAHQWVGGQVQFALPLFVDRNDEPDYAVTLSVHEGCYLAHTIVTPQMAYITARALGRPTASWLRWQVEA